MSEGPWEHTVKHVTWCGEVREGVREALTEKVMSELKPENSGRKSAKMPVE